VFSRPGATRGVAMITSSVSLYALVSATPVALDLSNLRPGLDPRLVPVALAVSSGPGISFVAVALGNAEISVDDEISADAGTPVDA